MSRIVFIAMGILLWSGVVSLAQSTVVEVDFWGQVRPYIIEIVAVVIAAAVAWATKKFGDLTGMQIEARHREALQIALTNAANLVVNRSLPQDPLYVDVKNAQLRDGLNYVLGNVPDAIDYFDLTPERLALMLEAKLKDVKAV